MGGTERFQENGIIQIENLVKRYGSFVESECSGRGNFRTSGTKRIG